MGKGDKKSRKGKIVMGSYGKRRKRNPVKTSALLTVAKEKKPKKVASTTAETKAPAKKKKAAEAEAKAE